MERPAQNWSDMTNDVDRSAERRIRARQTIKLIVWFVVIAALVVFAAVNTQEVAVDWVFDETETALWIVIAASAIAGAIVGFVAARRRR
jgi:uncharacterized integral membrane protein